MQNKLTILGAGAVLVIALLTFLFQGTGFIAGVLVTITSGITYYALSVLKLDDDFSLVLSIPLGLIVLSSLAYGIGFLVGLRMGAIIGVLIMAAAAFVFAKVMSKHQRKLNKTAPELHKQ